MPKSLKKLLCIFLGGIFLFLSSSVFALENQYPSVFGFSVKDTSTLPEFAKYIFGIGISIAFFVSLGVLAFGGLNYLISFGRGKFTSESKEWIKAGIFGLLIVVCSYLIAYTINPQLVFFRFDGVSVPNFVFPPEKNISPNAKIVVYDEIPLGLLTEKVLTQTTDCYGFDEQGNPIDGEDIKTDNGKNATLPTYTNHDRIDCMLKLMDGSKKKAKIINNLSNEITKLMDTCDCAKYGDCGNTCGNNKDKAGCDQPAACAAPGQVVKCTGACVKAPCDGGKKDCCPDGVKDKIEHGPIKVSGGDDCIANCKTKEIEYNGLDEFRCESSTLKVKYNQCSGFIKLLEKEIKVNKKTYTIIDSEIWQQLNLRQQLAYFKEKIEELNNKIKTSTQELDKAKKTISSGKCYMSTSYVDFQKKMQQADPKSIVIKGNRIFKDSETGNLIDPSKYCREFNYANSSCYKKCQDACPDTSPEVMQCYAGAPKCDPNSKDYSNCLTGQKKYIQDCYNYRKCIFGPVQQNFQECITSCQQDCSSICSESYLACSNDYKLCNDQCNSDSKCILDSKNIDANGNSNIDKCLLNSENFQQCGTSVTDLGNAEYCINNAYRCEYGSSQNSGYAECLKSPDSYNGIYNSSYIFQNPDKQLCPKPFVKDQNNNTATCLELYPETNKCPAASSCPACPCESTKQDLSSLFQCAGDKKVNTNIQLPNNQWTGAGQIEVIKGPPASVTVTTYNAVSPECGEYAYNDDPLTFYCQQSWWTDVNFQENTEPVGDHRFCPLTKEIPVGQTVDNAESWIEGVWNNANKHLKILNDTIGFLDKLGKAIGTNGGYVYNVVQDYCKCNAKLETNEPICTTDCKYAEDIILEPILDPDTGEQIGVNKKCVPSCNFVPCNGKPCKQLTDYLKEVINYFSAIKSSYANFYAYSALEARSDILKSLTYSRTKTNECSVSQNNYGVDTALLNCEKIEDELIPPINTDKIIVNAGGIKDLAHYCYGKNLGKVINKPLTDNWFCCEQWKDTTIKENNVQQ